MRLLRREGAAAPAPRWPAVVNAVVGLSTLALLVPTYVATRAQERNLRAQTAALEVEAQVSAPQFAVDYFTFDPDAIEHISQTQGPSDGAIVTAPIVTTKVSKGWLSPPFRRSDPRDIVKRLCTPRDDQQCLSLAEQSNRGQIEVRDSRTMFVLVLQDGKRRARSVILRAVAIRTDDPRVATDPCAESTVRVEVPLGDLGPGDRRLVAISRYVELASADGTTSLLWESTELVPCELRFVDPATRQSVRSAIRRPLDNEIVLNAELSQQG